MTLKFSSIVQSCTLCDPMDCMQHIRLPCPSPTPGAFSNSCPSSQWPHATISSSVVPSSHLQSFPAWGSFRMSQFFASGGQSIEVSASASVFPMNIQNWFPLGWTGWISLQSRDSQESSPKPQFQSINSSAPSFLYSPLSYPYMTTGKATAFTRWTFVFKEMSLLFNMLSSLVIAFLPRSKCHLISWLQSPSTVILEPPKINPVMASIVSSSICHKVMGPEVMILVFWMLSFMNVEFQVSFFTLFFHFHQEAL